MRTASSCAQSSARSRIAGRTRKVTTNQAPPRSCYSSAFPPLRNAMRFLARTFLLLLFTLPILAIAVVWLCFQDTPSVVRSVRLTPEDIENAKRIVAQHDPRKANYGGPRTVAISEQELDL